VKEREIRRVHKVVSNVVIWHSRPRPPAKERDPVKARETRHSRPSPRPPATERDPALPTLTQTPPAIERDPAGVREFLVGSLFLSLFLCRQIFFVAGFLWLPNLCDVAGAVRLRKI